jgi:hypothetical protein
MNELFPNNHEYTSGRDINKDRSHIWVKDLFIPRDNCKNVVNTTFIAFHVL